MLRMDFDLFLAELLFVLITCMAIVFRYGIGRCNTFGSIGLVEGVFGSDGLVFK